MSHDILSWCRCAVFALFASVSWVACDHDETTLVDYAPFYWRALNFGPRLPPGTPFINPPEHRDCSGRGFGFHSDGEGWFEATINGERVKGIASAVPQRPPLSMAPYDKIAIDFLIYDYETCGSSALFTMYAIDFKEMKYPQLINNRFHLEFFLDTIGLSNFSYGSDDQVDREYLGDTTTLHAPAILIDEIRLKDKLVGGRIAGRYFPNPDNYDPYQEYYPDSLVIEEMIFQASFNE